MTRSLVKFREEIESIELHVFGDASGDGVSSTVYAIVHKPSGVSQGLVAAKSMLAKQGLTIPRANWQLALAHMAVNLVSNVERVLEGFPVTVMQGWLDSTVVLYWINGGGEYKQFVANRISKIKSNLPLQWRHIPTKDNPADLGSRGGSVKNKQLWWNGPDWLSNRENWPADITLEATKESNAETKVIRQVLAVSLEQTNPLDALLEKFGIWKTLRVCARLKRFVMNCHNPNQKLLGPLTMKELEKHHLFWIKRAQSSCDVEDDRLRLNLQPNAIGILECRGHIQGRYPIYLPDASPYTTKLVEDSHLRTLHRGVGMTMARVRENYWIPRLRQLVLKVIKKCYGCRRFQAKALQQPPPGMLPLERTVGNHPFQAIWSGFRWSEVQEKQ